MGLMAGINNAKPNEKDPFLGEGIYTLEVIKLDSGRQRPPKNGDFVRLRGTVIESIGPKANLAGTSFTVMIMLNKYEGALGDVREMIAAIMNLPLEQVDEGGAEALIDPKRYPVGTKHPCAGKRVKCEVNLVPTQTGGQFSKHKFTAIAA